MKMEHFPAQKTEIVLITVFLQMFWSHMLEQLRAGLGLKHVLLKLDVAAGN